MIITADTHPGIVAAFVAIEVDNGGHLLGTVYPGERIDLERFDIPDAFAPLVPVAETGLSRLRADGEEGFETFCSGEESEIEGLITERGDLNEAQKLLNAYFDHWEEEA